MAAQRVFIVEDEGVVALELKDHLHTLGYVVCGHASNAAAALREIPRVIPDLILMDINLGPGMSGIDVAEKLRHELDVPVVFLSAYSDAELTRSAAQTGSFGYLLKPFDPNVLSANVQLAMVRHEATTKLRASEARFRALFEEASDGFVVTDRLGRCLDVNGRGCAMLGYSRDEIVGLPIEDLFVPQEEPQRRATALRERNLRRKDGQVLGVELSVAMLAGGDELVIVRDTSERKRMERAIAAEDAARAANAAKTMFIANMSHELRTPLGAVVGLSQALLDGAYGPLTAGQERSLTTIRSSGAHLTDLINDVLDIARIEAGAMRIELQPTALGPLVAEVTAYVRDSSEEKAQVFVSAVATTLPLVVADARRLRQLVLNLLTNAVKFSPRGARIEVGAKACDDGHVELWVADSGPGIAAADQARIFEPFVILDDSLTREQAGVGLGLPLVKRLAQLQRATVRVESEAGCGARFIVAFEESTTAAS